MPVLGKGQTSYKSYEINLNKLGFTKEKFRELQLTAFFHYMKLQFKGKAFSEIESKNNRYYIPFSFSIYETMAIVKTHSMKMLYLELDENRYIEIKFDTILIHGSDKMYNACKKMLDLAKKYKSPPEVLFFDFSISSDWLWGEFVKKEFENCMEIGENLFGNGYIMAHPLEEDEAEIITKHDFEKYKNDIEYLVIRSNIQENKVLLIDNVTKEALGTGFDEWEMTEIKRVLKGGGR